MATNRPVGDNSRVGAVRGRSQVYNPTTGLWTKRDAQTGKFMDVKTSSVLAYWYLVKYFWLLLPFYDTIKETAVISYGKTKKVQNQTYG